MTKTFGAKTLVVVVVMTMVLTMLAACGGGSGSGGSDNPVVGKWTTVEVDVDGEIVSMDDINSMLGMDLNMTFDFKADGKVTGDMMGMSVEGTYEVDGNDVHITFDGDTETFNLEGDKLIYDVGMGKLVLTK